MDLQKGSKRGCSYCKAPQSKLFRRPGSILISSGLDKCKKKGLKRPFKAFLSFSLLRRLDQEILGASYRPSLYKLARLKYLKAWLSEGLRSLLQICKSFKKVKRAR